MPDVPEVAANLTDLATVLTDPALGGFRPEHCVTVPPRASGRAVGRALSAAAKEAEDLLLFYFAGHGLIGSKHELFLGLYESSQDAVDYSALSFDAVRSTFATARADNRVVIIDSCFSGRAITSPLAGGTRGLAARMQIEGTYILTSAPPNKVALVRRGERNTAFTGRLLDLLREGSPEAGDPITFGDIYQILHRRMSAESLPAPQQAGTGSASLLGLVPNRSPRRPEAENGLQGATRGVRARQLTLVLSAALLLAAGLFIGPLLSHHQPSGGPASNASNGAPDVSDEPAKSQYTKIADVRVGLALSTVTAVFGPPSAVQTLAPADGFPSKESDFIEKSYWLQVFTNSDGDIVQYTVLDCDPAFHPALPVSTQEVGTGQVTLNSTTFAHVAAGESAEYNVPMDNPSTYSETYQSLVADNEIAYSLGADFSCSDDSIPTESALDLDAGFSCDPSPLYSGSPCGTITANALKAFRSKIVINAWSACSLKCDEDFPGGTTGLPLPHFSGKPSAPA